MKIYLRLTRHRTYQEDSKVGEVAALTNNESIIVFCHLAVAGGPVTESILKEEHQMLNPCMVIVS